MDLSYNEQQKILKKTARDFFEANCPMAMVRELEGHSPGYSIDMWRKMADLGLLGITYPESLGGSGQGFLDLYVIYEEMGRVLAPTPHLSTVILAGETVLAAGSEAQKKRVLPAIAKGEMIVATAIMEAEGVYGPEGIQLAATPQGRQYRLNGTKLLVPYADVADAILVAARAGKGDSPSDGITLFLIDRTTPGVAIEPLQTISGLSLHAVTFSNVTVPESSVVGKSGQGWAPFAKVMQRAAVLQCAELVGASEVVLGMATNYAKERVQFGRPIGIFQAVQYLCTDVALDSATVSLLAKQAAWLIDEGLPHDREVAIAKAAASNAAHHLTRQAQEVFAGIGFMMEHNIQMFTRRAKTWELNLGDTEYHLEAIAQAMQL